ncbi:MAG: peptide ABC transporter substrate-binding protein [Patescibacteria group bacterium]
MSRTERWLFGGAAVAATISLIALGGIILNRMTIVVPARGGEYVEGAVGQPTFVNPVLAASDIDRGLVRLLFAPLTDLAEPTDASANGRTWKVRLKENLRWSDDRKITSDDVIFTVLRLQDPEARSPFFSSWQGITVSRLSELELQFNLANPYPFFKTNLSNLYVIPKHLFADTPAANWRLSDYILQPVGSGPFVFSTYDKESNGFIGAYRLAANPRYFSGAPYLSKFTVRFFPKTEDLIAAFNTGAVDGLAGLAPETLARVNRSYAVWPFAIPSYYAVFFNQSQNLALKESAVRTALDISVDRNVIRDEVFGGEATTVAGPAGGTRDFSAGGGWAPGANPIRAGEILDAALWLKTEDGRREKKIKTAVIRLEFELTVPAIPFLEKSAALLAKQWGALGVRVSVRTLTPEEIADQVIKNRDYQALLFGNFLNPPGDLYAFWHSNERFYPGLNLALYSNKKADGILENIRRGFDPESRARQLDELSGIIAADAPAVFLFSPSYLYVASKDLRGVGLSSRGTISEPADRYRNVSNWHVKTTRALK